MARLTNTELQAEIDRLAAENAELHDLRAAEADRLAAENDLLRAELDDARSQASTLPIAPVADGVRPARRGRTSRWWTVLSVALITIGLVLAPAAVAGTWVRAQLTDTDAFVATFAPLADDPAVQAFVTAEVVRAIDEELDIDALTAAVFDGVEELGLPPRASAALQLLEAPASAGLHSLVERVVQRFVASDAFSDIWAQALRVSHTQLIATLEGDEGAAVTIGGQGEIGVQLGPIITEIKQVLVEQGIAFAANIPVIERTIVVAQSDSVVLVQLSYAIAVAVGTWLPWVALGLLAAGVLVARRRLVGLLGASVGLAVVMILVGSGLSIGELIFIATFSPSVLPADAAGVTYSHVLSYMEGTVLAATVLATTVAIVTWLASPFRPAVWLRTTYGRWVGAARASAERNGITTGRFGEWLYRQRTVVRVVVAIAAFTLVLLVRPLSPPLIIWTAIIAILLLGLSELLQRPGAAAPADADEETPVVVG